MSLEPATPPSDSPSPELTLFLRRASDPESLLAWLTLGDPLGLENKCALAIRRLAFLLDPEILCERVVHIVALQAGAFKGMGENALDVWLEARIEEAAHQQLAANSRFVAERDEVDPNDSRLAAYSFLLALPPHRIMPALVAFNRLSFDDRRAFFALLIEDIPVQDCLDSGMGPPDLLRERCMRALRTVLLEPLEEEGLL